MFSKPICNTFKPTHDIQRVSRLPQKIWVPKDQQSINIKQSSQQWVEGSDSSLQNIVHPPVKLQSQNKYTKAASNLKTVPKPTPLYRESNQGRKEMHLLEILQHQIKLYPQKSEIFPATPSNPQLVLKILAPNMANICFL